MSRNHVDPPPHHQHPPHGLMQQFNEFGGDLQWRRTVVILIMMMMMSVCMVLQSGAATSYNNDEFVKLKKVIEATDVTNTIDVTTSSSSGVVNNDTAATDLNSKLGLCASIIQGYGYPCQEITVQTRDGFLLGLQHIPHGSSGMKPFKNKRAVYLQHGVLQAGDDWVLNSPTESLAFILADQGFDVWIGNVRGTTWSHGHITLKPESAKFWDWSFDEYAKFDLTALVGYVYNATGDQIYYVGHSQGSIIALATFTMAETGMTNMVKAAALLSPIAYLQHTTSKLVQAAAYYMLDKVAADFGISEFSIYNELGSTVVTWACAQDGVVCKDIVAATWGPDCCFNQTRYGYYLEWEPQPTSTKNIQHLAQMVRGSNFSMFDYGTYGNLKAYNQTTPPLYELGKIPTAFPMLLCSGGQDALADPQDVERLLSELKSDVMTLYLADYAHADFVVGTRANLDVYPVIIAYFRTFETTSFEGGHVTML